jgi:hypothetical protein
MPRNSSGIYQLPSGNPVAAGTLIESAWANGTMSDLAQAMTDSLDRYGRSSMAAPLLLNDGAVATPGMAFGAEPSTGFYRKSAKVLAVSVGGVEVVDITQAGMTFVGSASIVGPIRLTDGTLAAPTLNFASDTGTGWYKPAAGAWGFGSAGTAIATIDATGLAITGNGAFSGNGTFGGTLGITGNATIGGTLGVTGNVTLSAALSVAGALTVTGNSSAARYLPGDGTAAAPAYSFQNDLTGGLFRPPGAIGFATGGVEKARLTTNADPQWLIGVTASVNGIAGRALTEINGTSSALLGLHTGGTNRAYFSTDGASAVIGTTTAIPLLFGSAAAEKMRLLSNSDASLLIGITAPIQAAAGRGLLEINGSSTALLALDYAGAAAGGMQATSSSLDIYASGASRYIDFVTNGALRWMIDASGNLLTGGGIPAAGKVQLAQYSTSGGYDITFLNRGLNASDSNTYNMGGIWAGGYRDVADPAFCAAITFERAPAAGGLASSGSIVFRTDPSGLNAKASLLERARINGAGVFTYQGYEVGWRRLPWQGKGVTYTTVAADEGTALVATASGITFNIPGGIFTAGDVITIVAVQASGTISIAATGGALMYWGTGAISANSPRTIARFGVVTLLFLDPNNYVITGTGIS